MPDPWFDAVATRYGCRVQGATEVALTNLDVLGYLEAIPVCIAYRLADGTVTDRYPMEAELETATPVLQEFEGWRCDISGTRSFDELPEAARAYVEYIESALLVRIAWISVGPRREQSLIR